MAALASRAAAGGTPAPPAAEGAEPDLARMVAVREDGMPVGALARRRGVAMRRRSLGSSVSRKSAVRVVETWSWVWRARLASQ